GQQAHISGHRDPEIPAGPLPTEELFVGGCVPAGNESIVAVLSAVLLWIVLTESDQRFTIGRQKQGIGLLVSVRPIGIVQFYSMLFFAAGTIGNPQIITRQGE